MPKNPKLTRTIRAEVTQEHFDAWERCRKGTGKNRQQFMALAADNLDLLILELEPLGSTTAPATALGTTLIVQLEPDRRIHVTTRQAQPKRFKEKLLPKAPECRLDIDESTKKRDILYHSSHEAEVRVYLAECPKGGKNERETHKPVRGKYTTKRDKALNACEAILAGHSGPMSIDELYPLVRAAGWEPSKKDFSVKCTLRGFLQGSPLFELDLKMDTVSLVKVDPPTVDDYIEVEELLARAGEEGEPSTVKEEPPTVEEDSTLKPKSIASFFPSWAKS